MSTNRRVMGTAETLLNTVLFNEKSRYELSRPEYKPAPAQPTRSSRGMSRVSEQRLEPYIFVRATQGHNTSKDPTAGMQQLTESNKNLVGVHVFHGCSNSTANRILEGSMIPGGPYGKRQANHFAAILPRDGVSVQSGFITGSQCCLFFNLHQWLEHGGEAWLASNEVVSIFADIPSIYFDCAMM